MDVNRSKSSKSVTGHRAVPWAGTWASPALGPAGRGAPGPSQLPSLAIPSLLKHHRAVGGSVQRPLARDGAALGIRRRARKETAGGEKGLRRHRHSPALRHRAEGGTRREPRGTGRSSPALPGPPARRSPAHPAGRTRRVADRSEKAGGTHPPRPHGSGPPPFRAGRGGTAPPSLRPSLSPQSRHGGGQCGAGGRTPLPAALRHLRG